jgi:flagellar motility protein MotE (MotC chaperone)
VTTQPEALRLADALDVGEISYTGMCKAAAELRRLHAVNAELLEALRNLARMSEAVAVAEGRARAAIAKAEEVKP